MKWMQTTSCSVGGGTRTHGLIFRRDSLYPLSYTDVLLVLYYIMSTRLLCPLSYVSTVWQE
jgi:hypothetical protein